MAMASRKPFRGRPAILLALIAGALWLAPPLPEDAVRRAAGDFRVTDFPENRRLRREEWSWDGPFRDALAAGRPPAALEGTSPRMEDSIPTLPPPEEMPEFSGSWRGYRLEAGGRLHAAPAAAGAGGTWAAGDSFGEARSEEIQTRDGESDRAAVRGGEKGRRKGTANGNNGGREEGSREARKKEGSRKGTIKENSRERNLAGWGLRKIKNGNKSIQRNYEGRIGRNRPRPRSLRRFRPILLSKLLGLGAIRPPPDDLKPPDFHPPEKIPPLGPGGERISGERPTASELELVRPPEIRGRCGKKSHWHLIPAAGLLHEGATWGQWARGRWSWLLKHERRWWLEVPPPAREGEEVPPLVRHGEHWWWKAGGRWFLLHQGEPWAYRGFEQLRSEGLLHPGTGTQMIYSADAKRVAVVTPGLGAVLFDAETGAELARWTQEQMPKPRRPAAPKALTFDGAK